MTSPTSYQQNITEFPVRNIEKIHLPKNLEDLRAILLRAGESGRSVYPISTGHNWGLGSRMPVNDADIIDLKHLNRIIEVNRELRYARVEPGVTQQQLYDYLEIHAPELMLNVTGSDAGSSILGNIMDRGSGKSGHRAEDLRELTLMLADGQLIHTGFGELQSTHGSFYKYGLGPDLTHLFTQSNYAIVTEAVVNLRVKQPFNLYLAVIDKAGLQAFLNQMAKLVAQEIVGYSLEIDSQNDPKIYELFESGKDFSDKWIAWFVVTGQEEVLPAKHSVVSKALASLTSDLKTYSSAADHSSSTPPVRVRIDRYHGQPNDHSLLATARKFGVELSGQEVNLDLHPQIPGFRCVLPVIPFTGASAALIQYIENFSHDRQLDPAISVIALNSYSLEVFARVYFDRSDQSAVSKAGTWASDLLSELQLQGIYPYRLDIENMAGYLQKIKNPYTRLQNQLKNLFDPNNTLAPGRYS